MLNEIKRSARYILFVFVLAPLFLLSGLEFKPGNTSSAVFVTETPTTRPTYQPSPTATQVVTSTAVRTPIPYVRRPYTRLSPLGISTPIPVTGTTVNSPTIPLTAEDWKEWPVYPTEISAEMRNLYQEGLRKGTDPTAFSIIGDCQSFPEVFLGIFDTYLLSRTLLPAPLQETAYQFSGSFGRDSPTIRDGNTAGAVLWNEWAKAYSFGMVCEENENPLTCELRLHNPSIVFVHIGTHWEARNYRYLTLIVETIKEHGAVPILVTKADNREGDERINYQTVQVAEEQGVPVWNFWAAVQDTPNQGLQDNSAMYLNEEAVEIHRYSAMQMLDLVWRAVK